MATDKPTVNLTPKPAPAANTGALKAIAVPAPGTAFNSVSTAQSPGINPRGTAGA